MKYFNHISSFVTPIEVKLETKENQVLGFNFYEDVKVSLIRIVQGRKIAGKHMTLLQC